MNFKMRKKLIVLILIKAVTLVFGQSNEKTVIGVINSTTERLETNAILPTSPPLKIICKQTKSCQQYDQIEEKNYKDLKTRKCMCDEKCPMYGDCCEDSIYFNSSSKHKVSFSCRKTFLDGYIYMADKCASNYPNSKIIKNCETTNQNNLVHNFLLTIPVTSLSTNITYKNGFCALCNNDLKFEFWEAALYFKFGKANLDIIEKNSSTNYPSNKTFYSTADSNETHSKPDSELILSQMKVDENRSELVSEVNGLSYTCSIMSAAPDSAAPGVRFCLSHLSDRLCSICERGTFANNCIENLDIPFDNLLLVQLNDSRLPKIDTCDDIPDEVVNKNVFCRNGAESDIPDACFYVNAKNEPCLVNKMCYLKTECKIIENGSLFVEEYQYAFPPGEYTDETSVPNLAFICGAALPMSDAQKMQLKLEDDLSEISVKFSIIFLILYLTTNMNKQKLRSLPNKILFSYCFTLLMTYLVFEIAPLLKSCRIPSIILHYLYLSWFTWLLVASYDFWKVICWSSTKLQTLAGKTRLKRYFLYCFIGWLFPLPIMAISIYFEFAPIKEVPCTLKPGYGRQRNCFISQKYPKYYLFIYPSMVIFVVILGLFAHTSYHIYLTKRKNIKSTVQNNYYLLFSKLALTMGLTWTLAIVVHFTDIYFFVILFSILNGSHGTLMFFVYCFKRTMLTKMYEMHKNNSIVQRTRSTFLSLTVRIRNTSLQPTASIDPPPQQMASTI